MKPFVRLRDGDATPAERVLLDSATDDVPSPRARAETLAALGLAGGAATLTLGATANAAGAGAAKGAGTVTALAIAKWVGTGVAVGVVTAGSVAALSTPELFTSKAPPAAAQPAAAKPTAPAARAPGKRASVEAPPAVVGRAPSGEARPAPGRPGQVAAPAPAERDSPPAPAPVPAASTVIEEVASLDRARASLATGDARGALVRLAAHERNFPSGALEPEAVLLKVRALVQLGQRAEAASVAGRFLAAHPNSSQASRLRAIVGDAR